MSARPISEVFVLGSGCSVNQLTRTDVEYVNSAVCVIALNKFMAFYQLVNIMPTHVFFIDTHPGSREFLQHIFDVCIENHVRGLTFVLNRNWRGRFSRSQVGYETRKLAIRVIRKEANPLVFRVPRHSLFEFATRPLSTEGGSWASSLEEPLYHYRGSLTSALNYASMFYPELPIKLVGVDLNSPEYFFQAELERLEIEWRDWTTPIVAQEKRHFSAIDWKGTTIFDHFDVILRELATTGNPLLNCNPNSMLVTRGFTPYCPVTAKIPDAR